MAYYLLDENNNKIEVTTEVLTRLVDKVKCCVSNTPFGFAFVTQAKYNELDAAGLLQSNTIYEIIDDTTLEGINQELNNQTNDINNLKDKHLYEHNLTFNSTYDNKTLIMYAKIFNDSKTPITKDGFKNYIGNKTNDAIMATGTLKAGSSTSIITSVKRDVGGLLICLGEYLTYGGTSTIVTSGFSLYEANMTVTDYVRQIY